MALYRLLQSDAGGRRTGVHMLPQPDGQPPRIIKPGEIIESDQPLDKLFRNKFEKVSDDVTPEAEPTEVKRTRKK